MPPRPFRFGVQVRTPRTAGAWLDTARRVERLGYDTVTMFDHPTHGLGPLAMLAAAAVATERVRLGTFVLATDYRHPVLLAQEAATIDQLSGGRLELGLGAGWDRAEYTAIGIPFDPPGSASDAWSTLSGSSSGCSPRRASPPTARTGFPASPNSRWRRGRSSAPTRPC